MREQEYVVKLNKKERVRLEGLVRKGKTAAQVRTRARILLHADRGRARSSRSNERIAATLNFYDEAEVARLLPGSIAL